MLLRKGANTYLYTGKWFIQGGKQVHTSLPSSLVTVLSTYIEMGMDYTYMYTCCWVVQGYIQRGAHWDSHPPPPNSSSHALIYIYFFPRLPLEAVLLVSRCPCACKGCTLMDKFYPRTQVKWKESPVVFYESCRNETQNLTGLKWLRTIRFYSLASKRDNGKA